MTCIYVWTRSADRNGEDFLQFIVAAPSKKAAKTKLEKYRFGNGSLHHGRKVAKSFFEEATYERFTEDQLSRVVERNR
jgi:hypothetical protein